MKVLERIFKENKEYIEAIGEDEYKERIKLMIMNDFISEVMKTSKRYDIQLDIDKHEEDMPPFDKTVYVAFHIRLYYEEIL